MNVKKILVKCFVIEWIMLIVGNLFIKVNYYCEIFVKVMVFLNFIGIV